MRSSIGLVVVALTVGCATEALETSEASQALMKCPDPADCTVGNGGGVYTEELGTVGIGANSYMIAQFVNTTNGVTIVGRGFNPHTGNYYVHPAGIYYATIPGHVGKYSVTSVSEWLTNPTFVLYGPDGQVTLTGGQLVGLQLVLAVDGTLVTLGFIDDPLVGDYGIQLQSFHAVWSPGEGLTNPQEYCIRAPNQATVVDPVVFQQGILVNPVTAVMARNNNYVTLSCEHGAIATVRSWGYIYRGDAPSADMFEAAMHMKRASYCGDETFFTKSPTSIMVKDSKNIRTDPVTASNVEAVWGRPAGGGGIRATCVNLDNLRHKYLRYPEVTGDRFLGQCFDGYGNLLFTIPACGSDLGDLASAPD